jgi:hypothetical protein
LARYTTIRVDPEVWECLVNRQALLTLKRGRRVSMNDAVKDILDQARDAEPLEAAAADPMGQPGGDDDAR